MKKYLFILTLIILTSFTSFSQKENYKKIFNDGDKESKFQIGIDGMTLLAGTPNIYLNTKLTPKFVINVGVGASLLGYMFELSGPINDNVDIFTRQLSPGYYYKANLRYYLSFTEKSKYDIFGQYYSLGIDHWATSDKLNTKKISKTRFILNGGASFDLIGRFNMEIEYGVYGGIYKSEPTTTVQKYIIDPFNPFGGYTLNPDYEAPKKGPVFGMRLGAGITFAL